ncbi:MAG: hypothetical protein GY757_07360, partial [bacterium]|nr:hypothetical protein [bacterium]
WIATGVGLNRYNGYENETFYEDSQSSLKLPASKIFKIAEDSKQRLYIGTDHGLSIYDLKTETTVKQYITDLTDPGAFSKGIFVDMIVDENHNELWISYLNRIDFDYSIIKLDLEQEILTKYNRDALSDSTVTCIYKDRSQTIWAGTLQGLNRYDRQSGVFKTYLNNYRITSINEDSLGNLTVGTDKGVFILNEGSFVFQNEISGFVYALYKDRENVLWITAENGLYQQAGDTQYQLYPFDFSASLSSPRRVNPRQTTTRRSKTIVESDNGLLWIYGTFDYAYANSVSPLFVFDKKNHTFKTPEHHDYNPRSPGSDSITSVLPDQYGNLWIATADRGVSRYAAKSHKLAHYKGEFNNPNRIKENDVRNIFEESGGALWIVTKGGGAYRYDRENDKIENYTVDGRRFGSRVFFEDKQNRLWMFSKRKLYFYDRKTNTIKIHRFSKKLELNILYLYEDKKNNFWICANEGLFRALGPQKKELVKFPLRSPNNFRRRGVKRPLGINKREGKKPAGRGREPAGRGNRKTVYRIVEVEGSLWASTTNGLVEI